MKHVTRRAIAWARWFGLGRLIAAAVSVVVIAAGGWWLVRPPATPTEALLPGAGAATVAPATVALVTPEGSGRGADAPGSTGARSADIVVVHVAGAVARPGLVSLPRGARVADAVAAAGGFGDDALADAVNLAAFVGDGERVYVPGPGDPVPLAEVGGNRSLGVPAGPIDLNTATAGQLDALPGVGPATAAAIIAYRQTNGPFADVEALAKVRGIGPGKLDALRPLVRV